MSDCCHSENCKFQMYRFNAEDPGQSLYTPTTVGVILLLYVLIVCFVLYGSLVYSLTFSFFSYGPCFQGPFVHPCKLNFKKIAHGFYGNLCILVS